MLGQIIKVVKTYYFNPRYRNKVFCLVLPYSMVSLSRSERLKETKQHKIRKMDVTQPKYIRHKAKRLFFFSSFLYKDSSNCFTTPVSFTHLHIDLYTGAKDNNPLCS